MPIKLIVVVFFLFFQAYTIILSSPTDDFIRSQCRLTLYPSLCVRSLANHATVIHLNPKTLATIALSVALSRAQSLSRFISALWPLNPPELQAFKDCTDNMANAIDQLGRSAKELASTSGRRDLRWRVGNVESWVTAAVTFQYTCAEGLPSSSVRVGVRDRVVECARVTGNSLALIRRWAGAGKVP